MKKIVRETYKKIIRLPTAVQVAAIILPGGFTAVGIYVAIKMLQEKRIKTRGDI